MPELNTFACDVCGVTKRDVNHWWIVWSTQFEGKPRLFCAEFDQELWDELRGMDNLVLSVACGEEHAQQLFARWLVSGSFDAPSQRPVTKSAEPSVPTREEGNDD